MQSLLYLDATGMLFRENLTKISAKLTREESIPHVLPVQVLKAYRHWVWDVQGKWVVWPSYTPCDFLTFHGICGLTLTPPLLHFLVTAVMRGKSSQVVQMKHYHEKISALQAHSIMLFRESCYSHPMGSPNLRQGNPCLQRFRALGSHLPFLGVSFS